jgi:hypothetical protein
MRFWRRNCVVSWRHRVDVVTCAGRNIAPAQAHDLTREQRAIADTVRRRTARFWATLFEAVRKSLILNGEMLERSIRHA